jgi:hypothetical protein
MAVFCEHVIEDRTGALTVVRVIDEVTITAIGPDVPDAMPPTDYQFKLVVALKSGEAQGRHTLSIDKQGPDGITRPGPRMPVHFEGGNRGVNVVVPQFVIRLELEGLYWFDVKLDGQLLTRMPLRVMYRPQRVQLMGLPAQ